MRKPETPVIVRTLSVLAASAVLASCGGNKHQPASTPDAKAAAPAKTGCLIENKRLKPGEDAFLRIAGGRMIDVLNRGRYKDEVGTIPHAATVQISRHDPTQGDGHIPKPEQEATMALNFETSSLTLDHASGYRTDARRVRLPSSEDILVSICPVKPEDAVPSPPSPPPAQPVADGQYA